METNVGTPVMVLPVQSTPVRHSVPVGPPSWLQATRSLNQSSGAKAPERRRTLSLPEFRSQNMTNKHHQPLCDVD